MNSPRSFRTTELAKEFSRQGHQVTVLTPKDENIHLAFENEYCITINELGKPKWKEIKLKGGKFEMLLRRAIRRTFNLLIHYPGIELMFLVKSALKKVKRYDMLISIAAPHPIHWGVAMARTKENPIAPLWVADCGDPFMGQENDTFKPPFYFKYLEKWFCKKADFITVPTNGAINAYYPEFRHKIKVIPQGFKFEEVKQTKEIIQNAKTTFAYAGGFIPGRRDPTEFLSFLISLEHDFEFHIYTNTPGLIKPYLKKANGRIILHEFIPRLQLLYNLSKMDFVINFENVGKKQTPSKLIDYAIIQKPILSIKTGELKTDIVQQFISGQYQNQLVIENLNQYKIENVCDEFLNLNKSK